MLWISGDHVNHCQFSEASFTCLTIRTWFAVYVWSVFLHLRKHRCLSLVTMPGQISPLWQPKATTKPYTICQRLRWSPGVSSKGGFHPLHALYTALLLRRKMGIWKAVDLPALCFSWKRCPRASVLQHFLLTSSCQKGCYCHFSVWKFSVLPKLLLWASCMGNEKR